MYILRKFNLISGKIDFQYVSSVEFGIKGILLGYDAKKKYAKNLTAYELRRVEAYLKSGGMSYQLQETI